MSRAAGRNPYLRVVMHSLAFGSLVPFLAEDPKSAVDRKKMEMTQDVMANSLVYWVQDLWRGGFLGQGSKVFAMTSEGSSRVVPSYGVVSSAKAALECDARYLSWFVGEEGHGQVPVGELGHARLPEDERDTGAQQQIGIAEDAPFLSYFSGNTTDPLSLHKYLYAHADPVNRVDPSGQFSLASFAISIAISAILTPPDGKKVDDPDWMKKTTEELCKG